VAGLSGSVAAVTETLETVGLSKAIGGLPIPGSNGTGSAQGGDNLGGGSGACRTEPSTGLPSNAATGSGSSMSAVDINNCYQQSSPQNAGSQPMPACNSCPCQVQR
jgi:hypothetical protein